MGPTPQIIWAFVISILGWALLFAGSAHAYVLRGPHVLELMISKYGRVSRLLVSQKQAVFPQDAPPSGIEMRETVRYVFPDTFRSELQLQNSRRIHVVTKNGTFTSIDGRILYNRKDDFDCYKDILLYRSRETLQRKLTWEGVDVTLASLGRFEDKIAFVLGAQYPDETRSQLWIEKETFRPMRWLIVATAPDGNRSVLEILYQDWQFSADTWYPRQITFSKNGRRVREIKVSGIRANMDFPGDLFNIENLKSKLQITAGTQPKGNDDTGISEIEKIIEDFEKASE